MHSRPRHATIIDRSPFLRGILPVAVLLAVATAFLTGLAYGESDSGGSVSYRLEEGETHKGDLYLFSGTGRIDGVQDGDLIFFGQSLEVNGTVTGDVNAWAQRIDLNGNIQDSARLFGQKIRVTGTIAGDLLAFGQSISIAPGARIEGRLKTGGAEVEIEGEITGDVDATAGKVVLRGKVGGDVNVEADIVEIEPATRIAGNLDYVSRNRIELDGVEIVGGEIDWSPSRDDVETDLHLPGSWIICLLMAMTVGLAALALFIRQVPGIVSLVGGDGLRCAGFGFITFVVVPVAGLLACILVITIPIVLIALMFFGLVVYLAKVPVAIWLGDRILARFGRTQVSPYLALVTGLPVLYLVYLIPYLGSIAWFACLFVGLGAIVLRIAEIRQQRRGPGGAAPLTPPPPAAPDVATPGLQPT